MTLKELVWAIGRLARTAAAVGTWAQGPEPRQVLGALPSAQGGQGGRGAGWETGAEPAGAGARYLPACRYLLTRALFSAHPTAGHRRRNRSGPVAEANTSRRAHRRRRPHRETDSPAADLFPRLPAALGSLLSIERAEGRETRLCCGLVVAPPPRAPPPVAVGGRRLLPGRPARRNRGHVPVTVADGVAHIVSRLPRPAQGENRLLPPASCHAPPSVSTDPRKPFPPLPFFSSAPVLCRRVGSATADSPANIVGHALPALV